MKTQFKFPVMLLMVIVSMAFTEPKTTAKKSPPGKRGDWVSLFDGKGLKGWHGYNKKGAVKNWEIEDGALVC